MLVYCILQVVLLSIIMSLMNITGIVVEYNPFHNGHILHINKARELTNSNLIIACMSGNFTQRGEAAIINKWERTKMALKYGVDLVVELPFIYSSQCASIFAKESVAILKELKINTLVFGSETNNLEELKDIASLPVNVDHLKQYLRNGESYPKAYGLLNGGIYPNDSLAVHYLRALEGSDIKPYSIKREGAYNDIKLSSLCSGKAIREALSNHIDIKDATPMIINEPIFHSDIYPYLRNQLLLSDRNTIQKIFLVNEGIEKLLIDNAFKYDNYDDFLNACVSKRYTKSRIERTILQILIQNTKENMNNLEKPHYIRILGFNDKGRAHLATVKEELKLVTRFKELPQTMKNIEEKASYLYASLIHDENKRQEFLKREMMGPVIIK